MHMPARCYQIAVVFVVTVSVVVVVEFDEVVAEIVVVVVVVVVGGGRHMPCASSCDGHSNAHIVLREMLCSAIAEMNGRPPAVPPSRDHPVSRQADGCNAVGKHASCTPLAKPLARRATRNMLRLHMWVAAGRAAKWANKRLSRVSATAANAGTIWYNAFFSLLQMWQRSHTLTSSVPRSVLADVQGLVHSVRRGFEHCYWFRRVFIGAPRVIPKPDTSRETE